MIRDLGGVLRLQVDLMPAAELSVVRNHSGQWLNLAGWYPTSSDQLTIEMDPSTGYDDEPARWLRWGPGPSAGGNTRLRTQFFPADPGEYVNVSAEWAYDYLTADLRASVYFYDVDQVFLSGVQGTNVLVDTEVNVDPTWTEVTVSALAPAGTAYAQVLFAAYDPGTTTIYNDGGSFYMRRAHVTVRDTATVTSWRDADWTDVLGETNTIQITRGNTLDGVLERIETGVLSATIIGDTVDPAVNANLRPGRMIRLQATLDDGLTWVTVFRGLVENATASYPVDGKTRVQLTAVDGGAALANQHMVNLRGRDSTTSEDYPDVWVEHIARKARTPMDGNAAWENLDGYGNTATGDATAAEWFNRVVANEHGYGMVDRHNIIRFYPESWAWGTVKATFTDTNALPGVEYVDIDVSHGGRENVNTLTVTRNVVTLANGSKEYGPYVNERAANEWGVQAAAVQVLSKGAYVTAKAFLEDFAAYQPQPRMVRFHGNDYLTEAATLDIYDIVRLVFARAGIDSNYRILNLAHDITVYTDTIGNVQTRWMVTAGLRPDRPDLARSIVYPAAGRETGPGDVT